jgi:hypothetical protein
MLQKFIIEKMDKRISIPIMKQRPAFKFRDPVKYVLAVE